MSTRFPLPHPHDVDGFNLPEIEMLRGLLAIDSKELAQSAGISPHTYSRWMKLLREGTGSTPRIASMRAVKAELKARLALRLTELERAPMHSDAPRSAA